MALEPYKDKAFLYEHYVAKRMNLTDIVKLLDKNYNLKTSPQTIYNWCKKYDLLKYRGKGRNLSAGKQKAPKFLPRKWLKEREWKCESRMILKRKVN